MSSLLYLASSLALTFIFSQFPQWAHECTGRQLKVLHLNELFIVPGIIACSELHFAHTFPSGIMKVDRYRLHPGVICIPAMNNNDKGHLKRFNLSYPYLRWV
jgi:hypothetical protein